MPEKVIKKLNDSINPRWKVCFFAAIAVGILAHFYKITNWLPNWDSLVFRYDGQNMIGLGRWFLPVVCTLSSFYDLPFLNGIIAIIFHALGAVCIVRILNVQKNITAFFIGAVTVSFPTVTSVMMYNYVADGYSVAFFLSALAALFMIDEKKPRYILSAVLIALSVGIYQAYITVTIMLAILELIDIAIYRDIPTKHILVKGVKMFFTGLLGMVIYYAVLKILLVISPVELLDYQGINDSFSLSNINIPGSLYTVKETFIRCFFDLSEGVNVYVVLNILAMAFTLAHYAKYIWKNKIHKTPRRFPILIVMACMLFLGAGALAFINAGMDYHNLMLMGYSIFYIFFIILYERGSESDEKHALFKSWGIVLIAGALVFNQIVIANVSYHKAQMAYEKSYGVLVRIADRIDRTEGTQECGRIAVIGALENSRDYSIKLTPDITGITDGYIIRADDETVGQSVLCSALNDYCDKHYTFLSGAEKSKIKKHNAVIDMPCWPEEGCIGVIDGTIVIKLGAESE